MIPLGVVAAANQRAPLQRMVYPLTYDESNHVDDSLLTGSGAPGPLVTPEGFEGDGYGTRYIGTLPAWVNAAGPLSMAVSVRTPLARLSSNRDTIVSLENNDSSATTRMQLATVTDARSAFAGATAVRVGTSQQVLNRPGWRYEFRSPVLREGSLWAKPQGVLFLDSNTVLFSVHMDDTESRVFKMRLSDGAVLGQFTFGTVTHRHVAAFARRANGEVWAGDYDALQALRLDLDQSFATGSAVITQVYNAALLAGFSAIEFATLGGIEYLVSGQYSTTDTGSFLKLIEASKLSTGAYANGDEYRSWNLGRRIQGVVMRSGKLMLARNALWGNTTTISGYIEEYDIAGMYTGLANDSSVNAASNPQYLLNTWDGPSTYVEDLAVHPVTNDLFTPTEGLYAVADFEGFFALWSSNLLREGVRNDYVLDHDGASTLSVKINGRAWGTVSTPLTQTAQVLCVGGPPTGTPSFQTGFGWSVVSNLLIQNGPVSASVAATLFAGGYESRVLTVTPVALTNPGAEAGSTTGWTVESGGMAVRQANPLPYEGAYYFAGGNFAQSVSRQRLSLSAVPAASIDSGKSWAKLRWKQSAYSNQDPGGMGVRTLNASNGTISTEYAPLAWTLGGGGASGPWYWVPRSYSVMLPSGTRSVDALYNASGRTSGTANDHYVDNVELVIYTRS